MALLFKYFSSDQHVANQFECNGNVQMSKLREGVQDKHLVEQTHREEALNYSRCSNADVQMLILQEEVQE